MAVQIDEILKLEVPNILRSHGFEVGDHPECRHLITTVTAHLKALLINAQNAIDSKLAIERLKKITAREKTYEYWVWGVCFSFVGFYKEKLGMTPGMGGSIPCDRSTLQVDYLEAAAVTTVGYFDRRDRHRPHGGRRRTSSISLPLKVHTVPSKR